jgi:hypothetical protein
LFSDLLKNNYYAIDPELIPLLKKRYELPKRFNKPLWALNEKEIRFLERGLNKLFPYGGMLYSFFRRLRKRDR